MQIVIAWAEQSAEFVSAGRRDLGERDNFKPVIIGKAVMWLRDGRECNIPSAQAYADREGYTVFTYEKEREPLVCARAEIVALAKSGKVQPKE